jgi:hypothetical protein
MKYEEFVMTREQIAWAKKLQKHLDSMPDGIEILFGAGHAHIHPEGWYMAEIWDAGADMMTASTMIDRDSCWLITYDDNKVRPNSESV